MCWIKKISLLILVMLAFASNGNAADTILAWDTSPSPDVAGYILYYDNDGGAPWQYNKNVGNVLTYTFTDLAPGTWHFTVTAYNGAGESIGSNIVNGDIPVFIPPVDVEHTPSEVPGTPGVLTITIHGSVIIQ